MTIGPLDWDKVRLVAFDVDGTLYHQRRLRFVMALELLSHALRSADTTTLRVLSRYRRIRERLGREEADDFVPALLAETASTCGTTTDRVGAIVAEWIERRPLRHLAACRYPGLPELFAALRRKGKAIGVLSDYPASEKLAALGLVADHVVCAGDEAIGVMKPHPRGLQALMHAAGATPDCTVLIGDRPERDGSAARRAGVPALIRSARPIEGWQTFARFDDAVFQPLLAG